MTMKKVEETVLTALTDDEIDHVQGFFNSDPVREELHTFTYRDGLSRAVNREDRRLYYTEDQSTITSAAMVWCESRVLADDEAQIRLIATHPQYRRQGFATQLTEQALDFASEWGKDRMKIEVAANEPAVDFWRDQCFCDQEYWETDTGREMITMERTIQED
jgi:ribosomal protein S18 acetylase RimI-like enzyme